MTPEMAAIVGTLSGTILGGLISWSVTAWAHRKQSEKSDHDRRIDRLLEGASALREAAFLAVSAASPRDIALAAQQALWGDSLAEIHAASVHGQWHSEFAKVLNPFTQAHPDDWGRPEHHAAVHGASAVFSDYAIAVEQEIAGLLSKTDRRV